MAALFVFTAFGGAAVYGAIRTVEAWHGITVVPRTAALLLAPFGLSLLFLALALAT